MGPTPRATGRLILKYWQQHSQTQSACARITEYEANEAWSNHLYFPKEHVILGTQNMLSKKVLAEQEWN